jgi:hypothetical protein
MSDDQTPVRLDTQARHTSAEPSAADLLRRVRDELYALCEATEDECIAEVRRLVDGDEVPIASVHQAGFYRGRKSEAKAISRAMGEVFRELIREAE